MRVMVLEWLVDDQSQIYNIMANQPIQIGRHPDCQLVFADRRISRRHAEIYAENGVFHIRTLSRTNPVAINGLHRLFHNEVTALKIGDVLRLGSVHIRVKALQDYADALIKIRCAACGRVVDGDQADCPYCGYALAFGEIMGAT